MKLQFNFIPITGVDSTAFGIFLLVSDYDINNVNSFKFSIYYDGEEVPYTFFSSTPSSYIESTNTLNKKSVRATVQGYSGDWQDDPENIILSGNLIQAEEKIIPNEGQLIKISSSVMTILGNGVGDIEITAKLISTKRGLESNGAIICRDLDCGVRADENGYWEMFLFPNDEIYPDETFYLFTINGEVFYRKISASNGIEQSFFELQTPSNYDYRAKIVSGLEVI